MVNIPGYHLREKIHQGNLTSVYRALKIDTQQPVILKVQPYQSVLSKKKAKLTHEFQIGSQIASKHVVSYLDIGTHEDVNFLVIEDDGGDSLLINIPENGFALQEFLEIALGLVQGLSDIHQRNIIHCDIKPGNITINLKKKIIKYIDFGSATFLRQESRAPISLYSGEGTLAYISPEQTGRINRSVDYRTDFYSLGATYYEMLCGHPPFQAESPEELIHQHIAQLPKAPHIVNPTIPEAISHIILKLLMKNAEDRYQSCYGLLSDLEKCLAQLKEKGEIQQSFVIAETDFSEVFQIPQKLYGREVEIKILLDAFDRTSQDKFEIATVTGYAGIGKSFLVKEIQKPLTLKSGYFISGKFGQLNSNIAFSALIEALRNLVRQILNESQERLKSWKQKLLLALEDNGQVIVDLVPELEILIGKQPPLRPSEPSQAKNRFKLALIKFITAFTQKKHPLILFLDDLQWADYDSLELLEFMAKNLNSQAFLLIIAYRDYEMHDSHLARITLANIEAMGVSIQHIHLNPLKLPQINQWVAETLNVHASSTAELAQVINEKTAGNPFFIKMFLQSLYDKNLIYLSSNTGWQWNIEKIKKLPATDNVIQLMIAQVNSLPNATIDLLKTASCLGKTFTEERLVQIKSYISEDVIGILTPALNMGLIQHVENEFQFAHDKVQEAVYALLTDNEKMQTHQLIGDALLAAQPSQHFKQQILFEIADHLNVSEPLMTNNDERQKMAQLNLLAGQKAKEATAYTSSLAYLEKAVVFSKEIINWGNDYSFMFSLNRELAEVKYLTGHFEASEATISAALPHLLSSLDKAFYFNILIVQKTLQGKYDLALKAGIEILSLLGVELPPQNKQEFLTTAMAKIKERLDSKSISSLIDMPEMVHAEKKAIMKTLYNLFGVCYLSGSDLLPTIITMMVILTLNYGHTQESCMGYATYGMLIGIMSNEYKKAYDFGMLSLDLSDKYNDLAQKCRCYNVIVNCIFNWVKPMRQINPLIKEGFKAGVSSGELQYAGYLSLYRIRSLFKQGYPLPDLSTIIATEYQFCKETKNQVAVDLILAVKMVVENLTGQTQAETEFSIDNLCESEFLKNCEDNGSFSALCLYHVMKAQVLYLYDKPKEAIECIYQAEKNLAYITGQYALANYNLYHSLILISLYPEADKEAKSAYWIQLEANQKQMEQWASYCQENFSHKYHLVAAEMARLSQAPETARKLYNKAKKECRPQQLIHEQALICELAAKFWLNEEDDLCAKGYINEAYACYQEWGAKRIVEKFRENYHGLITSRSTPGQFEVSGSNTTLSWESLKYLDLANLLKASQAISQEIDTSKLLAKIIKIVVVGAGAQTGALLLESERGLVVQAEYLSNKEISVLKGIPCDLWSKGATKVINHVKENHSLVILGNASDTLEFASDSYIIDHKVKSLLCLPIFKNDELKGILYLENNLTKNAFSKQQIDFLAVITGQMVISIENARYVEEQLVYVRQLAEHSERVKSAESYRQEQGIFISNLSHEIINPMFVISGYLELATEAYNALYDIWKDIAATVEDVTKNKYLEQLQKIEAYHVSLSKSINYVVRATKNVLRWQKLEAGMLKTENIVFRPSELLESIKLIFQSKASAKNIKLLTQGPSQQLLAKGDPDLIEEVLFNFVTNALNFTTQDGSVTIKIEAQNMQQEEMLLEFSVIDTGIGMSHDELKRLFQRFSQNQRSNSSKEYGGTGLGLSISKSLIEHMGGHIDVESAKGLGTTFKFSIKSQLPTAEEKSAFERHNPKGALAKASSSQGAVRNKILIVDDSLSNQKLLVTLLTRKGYDCKTASDGNEALNTLQKENFNLVLLDIEMPVMDGLQTAKEIRHREQVQQREAIPIILMSATPYDELQERIANLSINGWYTKATDNQILYTLIEKWLPPKQPSFQAVYQSLRKFSLTAGEKASYERGSGNASNASFKEEDESAYSFRP